jgi:hypothetical protein
LATTKLDDISEAIGSLRSDVRNLISALAESTKSGNEHRSSFHKRVDDLVTEVGT